MTFDRRLDVRNGFIYSAGMTFKGFLHSAAFVGVVSAVLGAIAGSVATSMLGRPSPSEISMRLTIVDSAGLSYAEPNQVEAFEADLEEDLKTYLLGYLTEMPIIRAYIDRGLFDPTKLEELKKKQTAIEERLKATTVKFTALIDFANSGDKSATIGKFTFLFPTNTSEPWKEEYINQRVEVDGNRTARQAYQFEMPLFLLLADDFSAATRQLMLAEGSKMFEPEDIEQFEAVFAEKLKKIPFIQIDLPVDVKMSDQYDRKYESKVDFSTLKKMLETARPPEVKEAKDASQRP